MLRTPLWAKKQKENVKAQITVIPSRRRRHTPANLCGRLDSADGTPQTPIRRAYSTGAGRDGKVDPNRPAMLDLTMYHEGEEVIPNDTVKRLGGSKGVDDMIQARIKGYKNGTVGVFDRIGNKISDVAGRVGSTNIGKAVGAIKEGGTSIANSVSNGLVDKNVINNTPINNTPINSTPINNTPINNTPINNTTINSTPIYSPPNGATAETAKKSGLYFRDPNLSNEENQANYNAMHKQAEVQAPIDTSRDESQAANVAKAKGTYYRDNSLSDTENLARYNAFKSGEQGWDAVRGTEVQATTDTSNTETPVNAGNVVNPQNIINSNLQEMQNIAQGNSKLIDRISELGFDRLGARQQTDITKTAMMLANNPNLTEGQKNTIMAKTMRNHGIENADYAGKIAIESMKESGDALITATNMAKSILTRADTEIDDAIESGDYEKANQIQRDNGIAVIDYTQMKREGRADVFNGEYNNVVDAIIENPNVTLADPDTRQSFQVMYDAHFKDTENPPNFEEWANNKLNNMKTSGNVVESAVRNIPDNQITSWFNSMHSGDNNWSMDDLSYNYNGQTLTGVDAGRQMFRELLIGGGMNADLQLDYTRPIVQKMFGVDANGNISSLLPPPPKEGDLKSYTRDYNGYEQYLKDGNPIKLSEMERLNFTPEQIQTLTNMYGSGSTDNKSGSETSTTISAMNKGGATVGKIEEEIKRPITFAEAKSNNISLDGGEVNDGKGNINGTNGSWSGSSGQQVLTFNDSSNIRTGSDYTLNGKTYKILSLGGDNMEREDIKGSNNKTEYFYIYDPEYYNDTKYNGASVDAFVDASKGNLDHVIKIYPTSNGKSIIMSDGRSGFSPTINFGGSTMETTAPLQTAPDFANA